MDLPNKYIELRLIPKNDFEIIKFGDTLFHELTHARNFERINLSNIWAEYVMHPYKVVSSSRNLNYDLMFKHGTLSLYSYSWKSTSLDNDRFKDDIFTPIGKIANIDVVYKGNLDESDFSKNTIKNLEFNMKNYTQPLKSSIDFIMINPDIKNLGYFHHKKTSIVYDFLSEDIAVSAESFSLAHRYPEHFPGVITFLHTNELTERRLKFLAQENIISSDAAYDLLNLNLNSSMVESIDVHKRERERMKVIDSKPEMKEFHNYFLSELLK